MRVSATAVWGPAVLLVISPLFAQNGPTQLECHSVSFSVTLQSEGGVRRQVGTHFFRMQPLRTGGWTFSLEDSDGQDFIYPVNPPLRLHGQQTFGAGYGQTAKQSLAHDRQLRFLLNSSDYEKMKPIVQNALWPDKAPDPERAADQYFQTLAAMPTGLLQLTVLRSDISQADKVRSAGFRVELTAPLDFQFDPSLAPRLTACPAPASPPTDQPR
jgi:hypothetical protein